MKHYAIQDTNIGLIQFLSKATDENEAFKNFQDEIDDIVTQDEFTITEIPEHLYEFLKPLAGDDQTGIDALIFFKEHEVWFPETHAIICIGRESATRYKAGHYGPDRGWPVKPPRAILKIGTYEQCEKKLTEFAEEDLEEGAQDEAFYGDSYEYDGNRYEIVEIKEESDDHGNLPLYIASNRLSYLI